jgi:hypothetical protein
MIRYVFFTFCLMPIQYAWSQQQIGATTIILGYDQHKAILAADSRGTRSDGSYDDHSCKIAALGNNMIFAATGLVSDESVHLPPDLRFKAYSSALDAYNVVKRALKSTSGVDSVSGHAIMQFHGDSLSQAIAREWAIELAERFIPAAKLSPWLNQAGGGNITGIFVAIEGTEVVSAIQAIHCTPTNILHNCDGFEITPTISPVTTAVTFVPFGITDIANKALDPTSNEFLAYQKARKANRGKVDREFAIRPVELTEDFSTLKRFVGGKVDVVELRTGKKPYWHQKDECKNQQQH